MYHIPLTSAQTATSTPVVIDGGHGQPVVVHQGPAWLAGMLYGPPWWVVWALGAVLGLVGIVVLLGARNVDGPDEWGVVAGESAQTTTIVVCIAVATLLSKSYLSMPYMADVAAGMLGGLVAAWLLAPHVERIIRRDVTRLLSEVAADG